MLGPLVIPTFGGDQSIDWRHGRYLERTPADAHHEKNLIISFLIFEHSCSLLYITNTR